MVSLSKWCCHTLALRQDSGTSRANQLFEVEKTSLTANLLLHREPLPQKCNPSNNNKHVTFLTKNVRVRRNAGKTTSRFAIYREPSDNEEIYAGVQIRVWILSFINRFSIPAVSVC